MHQNVFRIILRGFSGDLVYFTITDILEAFPLESTICAQTPNLHLWDLFWQEKHQILKKGIYVLALQSKRTDISFQKHFSTATVFLANCPPSHPPLFFCVPPSPPVYIMHTVSLIHSERGFSHI